MINSEERTLNPDPPTLEIGQVVQLHPSLTKNKMFSGCMFIVTEPKSWGAQGYVQGLGQDGKEAEGQAYYRATWEEIVPLDPGGFAPWVVQ